MPHPRKYFSKSPNWFWKNLKFGLGQILTSAPSREVFAPEAIALPLIRNYRLWNCTQHHHHNGIDYLWPKTIDVVCESAATSQQSNRLWPMPTKTYSKMNGICQIWIGQTNPRIFSETKLIETYSVFFIPFFKDWLWDLFVYKFFLRPNPIPKKNI